MDFLKNVFVPGGAERDLRRKATAELYERVPEVEKLERGKYSLMLNCPNGQVSTLFITLIATFPHTKPIFTVRGPLQHPWIDKYRFVTGCDNLNTWNRDHSRLADIVVEIKNILECGWNVPEDEQSKKQGANDNASHNSSNIGTGESTVDDQNFNQEFNPSSDEAGLCSSATGVSTGTSMALSSISPVVPQEFEKLKELSDEQLMRLLDDEVAFELFVKELDIGMDVKKMKESVERGNLDRARTNLSREVELSDLHTRVNELQDKVQVEIARYNGKLEKYSEKYTMSGVDIRKQLEEASNEVDLASENLGEDFVNGSKRMQDFLGEYTEQRERFHSLQAKLSALT